MRVDVILYRSHRLCSTLSPAHRQSPGRVGIPSLRDHRSEIFSIFPAREERKIKYKTRSCVRERFFVVPKTYIRYVANCPSTVTSNVVFFFGDFNNSISRRIILYNVYVDKRLLPVHAHTRAREFRKIRFFSKHRFEFFFLRFNMYFKNKIQNRFLLQNCSYVRY